MSTSLDARPDQVTSETYRQMVLNALCEGPMTCDEVADVLQASPFTIRPRISELHKAGRVADSGQRRALRSGKRGIVWKVVH